MLIVFLGFLIWYQSFIKNGITGYRGKIGWMLTNCSDPKKVKHKYLFYITSWSIDLLYGESRLQTKK